MIHAAEGPSGRNREYLERLAELLRAQLEALPESGGVTRAAAAAACADVFELAERVQALDTE